MATTAQSLCSGVVKHARESTNWSPVGQHTVDSGWNTRCKWMSCLCLVRWWGESGVWLWIRTTPLHTSSGKTYNWNGFSGFRLWKTTTSKLNYLNTKTNTHSSNWYQLFLLFWNEMLKTDWIWQFSFVKNLNPIKSSWLKSVPETNFNLTTQTTKGPKIDRRSQTAKQKIWSTGSQPVLDIQHQQNKVQQICCIKISVTLITNYA